MLDEAAVAPPNHVIDVGGGASSLVDVLLQKGFQVTVLDISEPALDVARLRLGSKADAARWIAADVTAWLPSKVYDVWHDRAVFHFLTDPTDRVKYLTALKAALRPGGFAVIATFAEDGPERCSGLPVQRYSAAGLARELGEDFKLMRVDREEHRTPGGASQIFTWALFERA
jgi:2-polyprenyl-3-methyl-5-hydroxy-6-metoxy-1,4-benzoquinol methylase